MAKTKFGVDQFSKHPPKWLVPSFAISVVVIEVIRFMVSGDPGLSDDVKLRVSHYLTGLTMLLSGLAPLFGASTKQENNEDEHLGI